MKDSSKICSICDRPMIRRTKQTGADAGIEFWVCSRFPECRNVEKCEPSKVQQKDTTSKFKAGNKNREIYRMDSGKEGHFGNIGMFFLIAGIFVFLVIGTLKLDLRKALEKQMTVEDSTKEEHSNVQIPVMQPIQIMEQVPIITQTQQESPQPRADNKTTALIVRGDNRFYVPVTIGYRGRMITVPLLIDTGATCVVISPAIAQRLGIGIEETTQGVTTIAGGIKIADHNAVADFVEVGPKVKNTMRLNILPHANNEEFGMLGMDFLAYFPHILDVQAQVIKWL